MGVSSNPLRLQDPPYHPELEKRKLGTGLTRGAKLKLNNDFERFLDKSSSSLTLP